VAPKRRRVDPGLRRDPLQDNPGNPNLRDVDRSAMQPARQQRVSQLAPEKRDRRGCTNSGAHDRTRRAVDTARQIDRVYAGSFVHGLDHGPRASLYGSVEAGPE
jgi:hypothetical protein